MNEIISYYSQFDEWGRLDREPLEFLINQHFIKKHLPKEGRVLDIGAGPGKYAMELARTGYLVTAADLTPSLVEAARKKAFELQLDHQFQGFIEADARNLNMLEDNEFDAVLMLGPMYHLQKESDRQQAASELRRVTKEEGVVFIAFMPRFRHILNSLISPGKWKPNDSLENIQVFSRTGIFNHQDEGRFTGAYYHEIEDIAPFMEAEGFDTIALIGSDAATAVPYDILSEWMSEPEKAEQLITLFIQRAADPSILGISSHVLYIGRKR